MLKDLVLIARTDDPRYTGGFGVTLDVATTAFAEAIRDMCDVSRGVTIATLRRHVNSDSLANLARDLGYSVGRHDKGLHLDDDYCVGAYVSTYLGKKVYYIDQSAHQYVFGAPISEDVTALTELTELTQYLGVTASDLEVVGEIDHDRTNCGTVSEVISILLDEGDDVQWLRGEIVRLATAA